MSDRIQLLVHCQNALDGTSWYRGMGPWTTAALDYPNELDLYGPPSVSWVNLKLSRVVFMQRPASEGELGLMRQAHALGRKVWIDYDDLLWHVPEDMPITLRAYYSGKRVETLTRMVAEADLVSVSTETLATHLRVMRDGPIVVLPNARLPEHVPVYESEQHKVILWRGGPTHSGDLASVRDEFPRLAHDLPEYRFVFWGFHDPTLEQEIAPGQNVLMPWESMAEYWHKLTQIRPSVLVVPLEVHEFNRAKSNNAWLEAASVGAWTVAPEELPEWNVPGVVRYKAGAFYDAVHEAVRLAQAGPCNVEAHIPKIEDVNARRMELLRGLV